MGMMDMVRRSVLLSALHKATAGPGAILSFRTDARAPFASVAADIAYSQPGSGDPSPNNVRPISGITGLTVLHRGKNLIDQANATEYPRWINNSDMWAYSSGGGKSFAFPVFGGMTYTVSIQYPATTYRVGYIKGALPASNPQSSQAYDVVRKSGDEALEPITFALPSDATYIVIQLGASILRTASLQVEYGSTGTPYEAYRGEAYPIDWTDEAGTVYGGTLDVKTGILTVTHAALKLGAATVFSESASGQNRYYCDGVGSLRALSGLHGACSHYAYVGTKATTSDLTTDLTLGINANLLTVYIKDSGCSTAADLNTYLTAQEAADTPVTIVYELHSPQTVQLTPNQIRAFLGRNNMSADAGTLTVNYWKHN